MTEDHVLLLVLGGIGLLWWASTAPIYIVAGKQGFPAPAWAFAPFVQFDLLARLGGQGTTAVGGLLIPPAGLYRWGALWAEISERTGQGRRLGWFCTIPVLNLFAQWIIALRAPESVQDRPFART
ncbi:MAG: hypothetical protein ACR2HN_12975 [Tepidiformaceae bacterium]